MINQSLLSIEPTKLQRLDLGVKNTEANYEPGKSYILSASVFKTSDVHKPPLTRPKFKVS
jgi:hypothetical protein